MLNLSLGDPAASIAGQILGGAQRKAGSRLRALAPGKTLHGTLACFCVCSLLGFVCASEVLGPDSEVRHGHAYLVAFISGISSAFAEAVIPGLVSVDDNLCIPLVSGACISVAF